MYTKYFGPISREELKGLESPSRSLQQGRLIAFPTETVYGLGATILNTQALKRLYQVKNRGADLSLPVQIANMDQLKFVATDIPHEAQVLAKHFLPGPLTLILKKNPNLSDLVTGRKRTVAVRFCSDPIARRLVELTGCPLAVPSANLTGKPSPTKANHVFEDFNGQIEGIVDGGEVEYGMESTLISLEDPFCPTLFRFGVIPQKEIEDVLHRKLIVHPLALTINGNSTFDKLRTAVRLFFSWDEMKIYLKLSSTSKRMIMSTDNSPLRGEHFHLNGKNLYEGLRIADCEGYTEVLVHCSSGIKKNVFLFNKLKQIART
ncbi:MAG: L-threonylcarbamoyladenylate synthase [Simkaniaceae bacterium]|nr:L-threonylcarbamoyladenylate synthase [Simkaniaceae bacterium]